MNKFGSKAVYGASKFGGKAIHAGAKFGSKAVAPAAVIGALVAPELAVPIEVGAMLAKPLLKTIQRASR